MASFPPSRSNFSYHAMAGTEIGDDLLKSCAKLFSTNYGIWGDKASAVSQFTKPGHPVKMSGDKLRVQCVSIPQKTVLVTCFRQEALVGHAFASIWSFEGHVVGWITQLVVDKNFRRRYIATHLLQTLKDHDLFQNVTVVGLASSHPAACNALAKYADVSIYGVDLNFIRDNAEKVLAASDAKYLKVAQPRGCIFQEDDDSGAISSVFTEFYVDHNEPSEALAKFKAKGKWCLGELLDGHEYLVIFPVTPLH